MKALSRIVHGGGWIAQTYIGRPKARLFGFISIVWLAVSFCGSIPFWGGWPQSFGAFEWLGGLLLVPQPVFITLALVFRFIEEPRSVTEFHSNPDHDFRKLY